METPSIAKVSLKLLIDTKEERVLFAEAGKDFVDFLFNLLHLPVGTVVRLLTTAEQSDQQTMANALPHEMGTLGNLYDSVRNLKETYFQSNQTRDSLLKPKVPFSATQVLPLLRLEGGTSAAKTYYTCPTNGEASSKDIFEPKYNNKNYQFHEYFSDNARAVCPSCSKSLSKEIKYVAAAKEVELAAAGEGGFVKGVVTYMVMDDLVVTPMSTISSITMLNKLNVKDVGALEEKVVDLGMPEGLKLLKASLHTKKVLTSVFLGNTGD
ncbi:hypothetical protein RHGRI_027500 [Rhododendron griersonianum]|uniref:DUF674 family protein n=1 Tax=Rhododendron griersonianum TaxID=479676 RepID=A0AAV6J2K3_9ERIC|nr:hypothetical protein RHGRI_027500 [Rhododendron griersonianum]